MSIPAEIETFSANVAIFCKNADQVFSSRNAKNLRNEQRDCLNSSLAQLLSINYKYLQLTNFRLTHNLFSAIAQIPVAETVLLAKACALIQQILTVPGKDKQQLHCNILDRLVSWLLHSVQTNGIEFLCDALDTLRCLLQCNEATGDLPASSQQSMCFALLNILTGRHHIKSDNGAKTTTCLADDVHYSAARLLEPIAQHFASIATDEHGQQMLADLLRQVVADLYRPDKQADGADELRRCQLDTALLNAGRLLLIAVGQQSAEQQELAIQQHIGELLGAARAHMMSGLLDGPTGAGRSPVRLHVSQQAIGEPSVVVGSGARGGKIAKTRKVAKTTAAVRQFMGAKGGGAKVARNADAATGAAAGTRIDLMVACPIPSESDFSETEAGGKQRRRAQILATLRFAALSLIGAVAQAATIRTMFGYWHAFFPDETLRPQSNALFNCALHDPNIRGRVTALHTASTLLQGSRQFLTQADNTSASRCSAYTPFSVALGDMICAMYEALGRLLRDESSVPVLQQALKCMVVLVQQTTFTRLRCGFVSDSVVEPVRRLIRHRDANVHVPAYIVLQELMLRGEKKSEIFEIIGGQRIATVSRVRAAAGSLEDEEIELDERAESDSEDESPAEAPPAASLSAVDSAEPISWLLQIALENVGATSDQKRPASISIRIESWHLIGTMARDFCLIRAHLDAITAGLQVALNGSNVDERLQAVKCIDVIGHFMNAFLEDEKPTADDDRRFHHFWRTLTPLLLQKITTTPESLSAIIMQSTSCNALSNLNAAYFERLPNSERGFLVCAMYGLAQSTETSIRAASIRALGIYVMFATLREDRVFVEQTIEAIVAVLPSDRTLDVMVKSSWALANVTTALWLQAEAQQQQSSSAVAGKSSSSADDALFGGGGGGAGGVAADYAAPVIDDHHLKLLFEAALACRPNDRVRCNGVRALGQLLRLIRPQHMQLQYWHDLSRQAIVQLRDSTSGAGNMKVKWNACYALGNCMRNEVFYATPFATAPVAGPQLPAGKGTAAANAPSANWLALVIAAMCRLVTTAVNFKVRSTAAAALAVPARRAWLGEHFATVWSALLEALEQSDQIPDYNELQHRDNLVDQLFFTLAHYISLASLDDLPGMAEQLRRFDAVAAKWSRVCNRIVPERAATLLAASVHLRRWSDDPAVPDKSLACLRELCECFVSVVR